MGLFNIFDPALDLIFGYLLGLPSFFAILIISLLIALMITLITKYFTNQDLMKLLKEEQKELQKEMKELKNKPNEMMKVNKRFMETNMKYMRQSMKSMLYTFLPIIIIFGWLAGNLSYLPIGEGEEFNVELQFKRDVAGNVSLQEVEGIELITDTNQKIVDGKAQFGFKSKKIGLYLLVFKKENELYSKKILISDGKKYIYPIKRPKGLFDYIYWQNEDFISKVGDLRQITTSNKSLKPMGNVSILGWNPGWLGTYIIFSLIFSIAIRKIIKVY